MYTRFTAVQSPSWVPEEKPFALSCQT